MSELKNRQKRDSVKMNRRKGTMHSCPKPAKDLSVLPLSVFLSGVKNLLLRVRVRLLFTWFFPTCLFPTSFFLRLWF